MKKIRNIIKETIQRLFEEVDEDTLNRMSDFGLGEHDIDENGYVTLYHGGVELPQRLNPGEIFFMTPDYATAENYVEIRSGQKGIPGEVFTIKVKPEDVSWNTGSYEIEFDKGGLISRRNGFLTIIPRTNEDINVPINVGDTVLGGKFKNKKIVVKDIDKNEKGDITINDKPLLRVRTLKEDISKSQIGAILDSSDVYSYCQKLHRNEEDFWDGDIGDRIERFTKYQVAEISINKITTDEYELDDDKVQEYIDKLKETNSYPPIVLGYYDSRWGYDIIDGTHRANALKRIGVKKIKCFVGLNEYQKEVIY